MSIIKQYLDQLDGDRRLTLTRIVEIAEKAIPDVSEGISYNLNCLMYKGKPVLGIAATKDFLSLYPFSGKVIVSMGDKLKDFKSTPGSIHLTPNEPISEEIIKDLIALRMEEIDSHD